ncbi:MAG: hypothetical protein KC636_01465 [Myxococcales bacterium]|nr:hypothetical protein [Myxococcales bacterium]
MAADERRSAGERVPRWFWAALVILLVFAFPYFEAVRNANELPRLLQGAALVEDGSFAIDGPAARGLRPGPDIARSPVDGRIYPNKPPGASLVCAVAYGLAGVDADIRGAPRTLRSYTLWARLLTGVLPTLLLCVAFARRLAEPLGARPVMAAVALYALATPAWSYGHLVYGHQLAACLLWIGLLTLLRAVDEGGRAASVRALVGGALAGASVVVDYNAVFAGLPIAGWIVWSVACRPPTRAPAIAGALGACLPILGLCAYHDAVFGSPLQTGYHHVINPEFARKHGEGLLGLGRPTLAALHTHITSTASGLTWWAPLWLVGAWGLARGRRIDRAPVRHVFWVSIAVLAVYVLTTASLNFEGGWRVGPRYLVIALPAVIPGVAWSLARPIQPRLAPLALAGIGALAAWSVTINGLAANLWPHIDLTNVHQPVSEVLLPLLRHGRAPYHLAFGVEGGVVWAIVAAALALVLWTVGRARAGDRGGWIALIVGAALGLGLVAATPRLFTPHPRAAANLRYIEKVWEPTPGRVAPSRRFTPR